MESETISLPSPLPLFSTLHHIQRLNLQPKTKTCSMRALSSNNLIGIARSNMELRYTYKWCCVFAYDFVRCVDMGVMSFTNFEYSLQPGKKKLK